MSPLRLVLRNVRRNLARSIIMGLLLFVFMFIFSVIAGVLSTVGEMRSGAEDSLRLGVSQKYAGAWKSEMPNTYVRDIAGIEGVVAATGLRFIGGTVRSEDDWAFGYAVEPETIAEVRYELAEPGAVRPEQWRAFTSKREGVLVGFRALQKHGWSVGRRHTIKTWGNLPELRFEVVGTIDHADFSDNFLIHLDYMEDLINDEGKVEQIGVRVASPTDQDRVARAIANHFQGRPVQVVVRSDEAFIANMLEQMSDFVMVFYVLAIVIFLTCFAMTLVSLSMTIRERTTEIALLRALGFSVGWIRRLTVVEASVLAGIAGTAGAFAAQGVFRMMNLQVPIGFTGSLNIPMRAVLLCSALAFVLGGSAAVLSLRSAFRAEVAHVLRKVV